MSYYNNTDGSNQNKHDEPPSYYDATEMSGLYQATAPPSPNLAQPHYQPSDQLEPREIITVVTTTTQTSHNGHVPRQALPNVVDLQIPTGVELALDRQNLVDLEIPVYDQRAYEEDKEAGSCCSCCDGFCTIFIYLATILVAVGVFLLLFKESTKVVGIVLLSVAGPCALLYYTRHIMCTYLCCNACCDESYDQCCLSSPYFSSIFRSSENVRDSIEQLSRDVPQLLFRVHASHTERRTRGTGKNRRTETVTVVTYDQWHTVPIAAYRYAGLSADDFLSSLDRLSGGEDLSISYSAHFAFDNSQSDYFPRYKALIYAQNKHRDRTVIITPALFTYHVVGERKIMVDHDSSQSMVFAVPGLDPESQKNSTITETVRTKTSLGNHTDVYNSKGAAKGGCANFWTSKCCWTLSMLTCFSPCAMCCWHSRFSQLRYRATFHIQLLDINQFHTYYNPNNALFIAPQRLFTDYH